MLLRALLVEDEDTHACLELRALHEGFGPSVEILVHRARTFHETLDAILNHAFDVAVVDYHLDIPGAGGASAQAVADSGIPFVVISHHMTGYAFRGVPILPKEPRFEPLAEWARLWLEMREGPACE